MYTYSLCESTVSNEDGECCTVFGITATSDNNSLIQFPDISCHKHEVVALIDLLYGEEIEPHQLTYIIEDYVQHIFSLE